MKTNIIDIISRNIVNGRFNWLNYCSEKTYFGVLIQTMPLFCSYGQIGFSLHFPYSDLPSLEWDWELNKLTIKN